MAKIKTVVAKPNKKRGRKPKYKTEAERKAAFRLYQKNWYEKRKKEKANISKKDRQMRLSKFTKQIWATEAVQKLLAEEINKIKTLPASLPAAFAAELEARFKSIEMELIAIRAENAEIKKDLEMLCEDISKLQKQSQAGTHDLRRKQTLSLV